jgi:proteasome regulatory subunit
LNNIHIIALINRKDLIDEAILMSGRIEVNLEIFLLSEQGCLNILKIHTQKIEIAAFD